MERKSIFNESHIINKTDAFDMFSACFAMMTFIQLNMEEIVECRQDWQIDIDNASITFGDKKYLIQIIGSESESDNTFLWGFTNINNFDESIIKLSKDVKSIGERWDFEILTEDGWNIDQVFNGHNLSMLFCSVIDQNLCYYRCPYEGGALYVAITDAPNSVFAPADIIKFMSIVSQSVEQFGMLACHKIMVYAFLMYNGNEFSFDETSNKLTANFGEQTLSIEFKYDEDNSSYILTTMNRSFTN